MYYVGIVLIYKTVFHNVRQRRAMADKSIQVLDRAFDIIEILAVEKDGLGVTEIGNRLDLHKSTVHRIISALTERGYVEKSSDRASYKLGLKLIEISSIHLNSIELKTEARPYLNRLVLQLKQPVHLATLDGCDVVYIDKVETTNSIRLYSQIGRRVPCYCSALGKCLLSGLEGIELDNRLNKVTFNKFTEYTLKSPEALKAQVLQTFQTGWAMDDEEHEIGIRCIAAPIWDYRDKVIAAVSASGPVDVFTRENCDEVIKNIKSAALEISARMGSKRNIK